MNWAHFSHVLLFSCFVGLGPAAVADTNDYVPGEPHSATSQTQGVSAKGKRPLAQERELLVRVSASTRQGLQALTTGASSTAIKRILAHRASSVRSVVKLPSLQAKGLHAGSSADVPPSREWLLVGLRKEQAGAEACKRLKDSGLVDASL